MALQKRTFHAKMTNLAQDHCAKVTVFQPPCKDRASARLSLSQTTENAAEIGMRADAKRRQTSDFGGVPRGSP